MGNRIALVALLCMPLFVLPTVLLSASFLKSVSYFKVLVLACLLAVTVYSLVIGLSVQQQTKNLDLGQVLNGRLQTVSNIEIVKIGGL